jgi:hypothetical protein
MSAALHWGHRSCFGNVVAPHLLHVLPINCDGSSGHVDNSGASAFCMGPSVSYAGGS